MTNNMLKAMTGIAKNPMSKQEFHCVLVEHSEYHCCWQYGLFCLKNVEVGHMDLKLVLDETDCVINWRAVSRWSLFFLFVFSWGVPRTVDWLVSRNKDFGVYNAFFKDTGSDWKMLRGKGVSTWNEWNAPLAEVGEILSQLNLVGVFSSLYRRPIGQTWMDLYWKDQWDRLGWTYDQRSFPFFICRLGQHCTNMTCFLIVKILYKGSNFSFWCQGSLSIEALAWG